VVHPIRVMRLDAVSGIIGPDRVNQPASTAAGVAAP
jgi:hypothetical protein